MPNIVEYNAPQGEAIRPSELPETSYQLVGRRAGNVGNETAQMIRQAGQEQQIAAHALGKSLTEVGSGVQTVGNVVERHEAQQELLSGATALAMTADGLTQQYDQMLKSADPFDPGVSQRFREQVLQPTLASFADNFQTPAGKEWAATHAAGLATQLYRHTVAVDANRAADQAQLGINQTTNQLSTMVQRDPALLDTALGMIPGTLDAMAGQANVSPELQERIRTELGQSMSHHVALAGLKGAIDQNPEAGLALANSGRFDKFISGAELDTLGRYARTITHIKSVEAKVGGQQAEATQSAFSSNQVVSYGAQLATGQMPPDFGTKIAQDEHLLPQDKGALLAAYQLPADRVSDPRAIDGVLAALSRDTNRPRAGDIIQSPNLSPVDAHWLASLANQLPFATNSGLTTLRNDLTDARVHLMAGGNAGSGVLSPAGLAAYGRFQSWLVGQARSGGELPTGKDLDAAISRFRPKAEDTLAAVPVPASPPPLSDILGAP